MKEIVKLASIIWAADIVILIQKKNVQKMSLSYGKTRAIMRKNSPCKDCQRRFLNCHSICKQYFEWKADNDVIREKEYRAKSTEWMLDDVSIRWREKTRRNQHLR